MGTGEMCAGQVMRMQGGTSVVKSPKLVLNHSVIQRLFIKGVSVPDTVL